MTRRGYLAETFSFTDVVLDILRTRCQNAIETSILEYIGETKVRNANFVLVSSLRHYQVG